MKVKVYMDLLNYNGDVTDHCLIAQFRSMGWAKDFIKQVEEETAHDKYARIVVEEKE